MPYLNHHPNLLTSVIWKPIVSVGIWISFSACATATNHSFGKEKPREAEATCQSTNPTLDPIVTDGDKYRVVLENSHVRVLRYADKPGNKTSPHHHDAFVLYALSSFRRRLIFPDGTIKERDFKPGDVIWMPAQIHIGENIGDTDTDVLIVEQKPLCLHPTKPARLSAEPRQAEASHTQP